MRKFLLISSLLLIFVTADAQMNCNNFCVSNITIDTANNELNVTIINGDSIDVNYPIVQVVNALGDTVGNRNGQFYLFAQPAHTTYIHTIPTTLDSLPTGFTGIVYFTDPMVPATCMFTYPMTCTVGVNELNTANAIRVYPNPATDNITIAIENLNNKNAIITIYNMLGSIVRSYTTSNDQLNINRDGLENGMYFITVITEDNRHSNKLIIKQF